MTQYPKRLIEVDLPIKKISEHARREKSARQGHISTLHIWWARRPLAACRAVICAALWPDPAQDDCPPKFRNDAAAIMTHFWNPIGRTDLDFHDPIVLRKALLDFIAEFSNWDNSIKKEYLETARALTESAHESLGGVPGTVPLVMDPFAGGGAIPFEALRVGADAFASDLNPVAVLLNEIILEYIPTYGRKLVEEVRHWGEWIKVEAEKELAKFYPRDPDGAMPIAYLWARTIKCEGPGCGVEVPIILRPTLSDKPGNEAAISICYEKGILHTKVVLGNEAKNLRTGTNRRSSVTCPACGYTTPRKSVERQAIGRGFGYHLLAVCTRKDGKVRYYRQSYDYDLNILEKAKQQLSLFKDVYVNGIPMIPSEELPYLRSIFNVRVYGIDQWGKLFTHRQLLSAILLTQIMRRCAQQIDSEIPDRQLSKAIIECLSLSISNSLQFQCNITTYPSERAGFISAFIQGQSLPMKMDFVEVNPLLQELAGGFSFSLEQHLAGLEYACSCDLHKGTTVNISALTQALPDDSCDCLITDPPYYDAIPYADCSDFFYVWIRRMLIGLSDLEMDAELVPKTDEIVQLAERNERYRVKTKEWFENRMKDALENARCSVRPNGLGIILFAHKDTAAWEAMLQSVLRAGWIVTSSWPIDTENANRMRASESAALSSTIHITCRPRENSYGRVTTEEVGDWREVLAELPPRIQEWMSRLSREGIVGADAIFACLGPAIEIYSRYSRVEKASGEIVTLKEYLEEVWAAVSKEALSTIFSGDVTGFEEDARLTAMWLWTLSTKANGSRDNADTDYDEGSHEESIKPKVKGFLLEYDAARKIAQGLGAHLETLPNVVEVKGKRARLLSVSERMPYLFGKVSTSAMKSKKSKKKMIQATLPGTESAHTIHERDDEALSMLTGGSTALDRLHQAMLLFAEGHSEALKRFLVDEIGPDQRIWNLAQALSALYPSGSEERRWVEGVLARKKGLGL